MRDVTVYKPFARLARGPDDVIALARADVDGVGLIEGAFVQRRAVDGDDLERSRCWCGTNAYQEQLPIREAGGLRKCRRKTISKASRIRAESTAGRRECRSLPAIKASFAISLD